MRKLFNRLLKVSNQALSELRSLEAKENRELQMTLNDIEAVGYLGRYYAHKIAGSTNVALFRATKDKAYHDKAIADLERALLEWQRFADKALAQNKNPLWTNHVGMVDFKVITQWVKEDIDKVRSNPEL